jgi:glyoxylase-like metal-dependent hydrolase (beta-lactamase superfamily II)
MRFHVVEGNRQHLDGGAMFGHVPREMWKNWIAPDAANRIPLACRALLLQTKEGKNILFEAGIGAFFEPKLKERYGVLEHEHMLITNLAKLGIRDTDIDQVVLSHLHFDHAGGLLSAYGHGEPHLLFPKAKIYIGRDHWDRAKHPHLREKTSFVPIIQSLLENSDRLVLIAGDTHPDFGSAISFRYAHGHTIGLMLAQIRTERGPIVFASDLIPGVPWLHLPVAMGYDRYPEKSVDEKAALLDELIRVSGKLFFTHDPATPCVALARDNSGKYVGIPVDL